MWGYGSPSDAERDFSRLVTLIETRGERSILIDFPSYAKLLDFALSRGQLRRGLFPLLGKSDGVYPAFMRSHFERVFDSDGLLLDEADAGAVSNLRQCLRAFQKVEIPCGEAFIKETVDAFFATDGALRPASSSWYTGSFDAFSALEDAIDDGSDEYLPGLIGDEVLANKGLVRLAQRVCDTLVGWFPRLIPSAIMGNHGPGSVADAKPDSDKYLFPTWPPRLERVFERDIHASANVRNHPYHEGEYGHLDHPLRELPAKLIPVPKNQEKPRLIASEPTANQFIQGGIGRYLRGCVSQHPVLHSCIHFLDQGVSQSRALEATDGSGRIATVDLKDASDRLSCWTVERVFRRAPDLLEALASSRSMYLVDRDYGGGYTVLRKYAPQGNATVFPLQSITYAMLAIAAVVYSGPGKILKFGDLMRACKRAAAEITVFGDDIIIPAYALPALSSLLELSQLKVNGAKSHFSGNFAESCGCDAFRMVDVTPAYVKSIEDKASPGVVASHIAVSNNFYKKGLFHTSRVIESWIPEHYARDIPVHNLQHATAFNDKGFVDDGPLTLGTFSPGTAARRERYNSDLYREEVLALTIATRQKIIGRDEWQSLLQYFTERPGEVFEAGVSTTPKYKSGVKKKGRQRLRREWVSLNR